MLSEKEQFDLTENTNNDWIEYDSTVKDGVEYWCTEEKNELNVLSITKIIGICYV